VTGRDSTWKILVWTILFLAPGLSACAGKNIENRNIAHSPSTRERATDIVDQPWYDLNLSRTAIPPLLIEASAAPYAPPSKPGCAGLVHEIGSLNEILGPDLRPAAINKHGSLLSKKQADDASWGVARGFVDGFIPFRGVIRVFSGADEHENAIAHAILAGFVRRAYLEGLKKEQSCPSIP